MPKITKNFITTDDTNKTYEMPGYGGQTPKGNPQLWAIEIKMDALDNNGNYHFSGDGSGPKVFFVERQTLERLGMTSYIEAKPPVPPRTQEDEIRETLEKLLSLVGVYPEE